MPKAILEFNLPEEEEEFHLAQDGIKWMLVAYKLNNWLRSQLKHGDITPAQHETYTRIKEVLQESIMEYGLQFS